MSKVTVKSFAYKSGQSTKYIRKDGNLFRIGVHFRNGGGEKNLKMFSTSTGWQFVAGLHDIDTDLRGVSYVSSDHQKINMCSDITDAFSELLDILF